MQIVYLIFTLCNSQKWLNILILSFFRISFLTIFFHYENYPYLDLFQTKTLPQQVVYSTSEGFYCNTNFKSQLPTNPKSSANRSLF